MRSGTTLLHAEVFMNSKGFVFLPVLLMTALFILTAAYGLSGYEASLARGKFEALHTPKRNLEMTFNFLYANEPDCTTLFLPAANGRIRPLITATMQGSQAQSSGTLSLNLPNTSVPIAGQNTNYQGLQIKNTTFTRIRRPNPAATSFLVDLSVSFSPSTTNGASLAPLTLPFYVIADGAGNPTQCYLSRYMSNGLTMEDQLCETASGVGYRYEPVEGKCFL